MSDFLFQYHAIEPTTWVYLSSLLLIGLFFKFSRVFSVRNLDLFLLILLGPGLLMVYYGQSGAAQAGPQGEQATQVIRDEVDSTTADSESQDDRKKNAIDWPRLEVWGFRFLFAVGGLLFVRLLLDSVLVRRPLLEPNLSRGGLFFIGISLFVFLMANVIVETPSIQTDATDYRIARVAPASTHGPGYELLSVLPTSFSKVCCVMAHLLIVVGMVLIGYRHFRNITMGVGAAALYLMLPYTSLLTGRIEHVVPAAILVWAVLLYRQPVAAGSLIGLASGLVYYPFFLLPLWLSFYWHRGFRRFLVACLTTITALTILLLIFPGEGLQQDLVRMFGFRAPAMSKLGGIWSPNSGVDANYRIPILVAFVALSASMALWPAQKNLGTLISCSAAVMVASQFWHGYGGGTYMAWYLPLTLLTVFRPNLEDRVAVSMLVESWLPKKLRWSSAA